jgi:hypothetical protein
MTYYGRQAKCCKSPVTICMGGADNFYPGDHSRHRLVLLNHQDPTARSARYWKTAARHCPYSNQLYVPRPEGNMGQNLKKLSKPKPSKNAPLQVEHGVPESWQNPKDSGDKNMSPQTLDGTRVLQTTVSTASATVTLLPEPHSVSSYRPLDRSRNEIRLLRIFPPAASETLSPGLSLDSDAIQCQLEYESIDAIEELNKQREVADICRTVAVDLLFQGMPEAVSPNNPTMPRIAELLKRGMKKHLEAADGLDTRTQYNLDPGKMNILKEVYERSQQTISEWLPSYSMLLRPVTKFKSWMKSWIWSPLSGNETYAKSPSKGYFALSYVWADPNGQFHYDNQIESFLNLGKAGGLTLDQLIDTLDISSAPERFLDIVGLNTSFERPLRKSQILLDGKPIEIGENLEKALRTLREIPEVRNGTRIWVDSLCIDQDNIGEKNMEVKRMGDVYKNAERVISWLGEEKDRSGDALEVMAALGESILTADECKAIDKWLLLNLDSELVYRITQFLCRPYWTRIWIVQEIAMARTDSLIICGARKFPTSHILMFGKRFGKFDETFNNAYKIGRGYDPTSNGISIGFLERGMSNLRNLWDMQNHLDVITSPDFSVSTLWFRVASGSNASDPRDLVYGMMNLMPSNLVSLLRVEYSADNTYQRVMIDFSTAFIESKKSLMWILYRPWAPFLGYREWPSWVPNLGLPFSSAHFHWTFHWTSGGFSACEGLGTKEDFSVHISANEGLLVCHGFSLDAIYQASESIASTNRKTTDDWASQPGLLEEMANQAGVKAEFIREVQTQAFLGYWPEDDRTPRNLPRTSNWHRYEDESGLKEALSECFSMLKLKPTNETESIFNIPQDAVADEKFVVNLSSMERSSTVTIPALKFLAQFVNLCNDLDLWGTKLRHLFASDGQPPSLQLSDRTLMIGRLFTTCSGYIGAALCNIHAGDTIFILRGCPMPVILRPSLKRDGAWELLGAAYIPGVMNGEAVADFGDNGGIPISVMLC